MKEIILKNSEWMRGLGHGWLLHCENDVSPKMCCIGIVSKSLGAEDADLREHTSLTATIGLMIFGNKAGLGWMFNSNPDEECNDSTEAAELFQINDASMSHIDAAFGVKDIYGRVDKLNEIFNKHDINLVYREDL